jgi:hypothetical protein
MARLKHRIAGPYRDMDTALRVAIDEAQQIRRAGHPVHIAVNDADRTIAIYRLCSPCTCDLAATPDQEVAMDAA